MKSKVAMRPFEEYLIESLKDPEEAQGYLFVALEEYSQDRVMDSLLDSLHSIAAAKGGTLRATEKSVVDQNTLSQVPKVSPSPQWETVIEALGMSFSPVLTESLPSY